MDRKEHQRLDASIPKCKCGNNLSLHRQELGVNNCPACDEMEEIVTITKAEYDNLKEDRAWLRCLESAGVDNWEGYDQAIGYKRT